MNTQYIYDNKQSRIGQITENGNVINAYGAKGQYLGQYWKNSKTTYDSKGGRFANGDATVALIFAAAGR
ncbi:MAG: hypothetical protein ACO3U5_04130 [Aquiluna sp.]|jgi:hypothetical protein